MKPGPAKINQERDIRIAKAYAAGCSLRDCKERFGLSIERIRQIVIRQGVKPRKLGSGQ